MFERQKRGDIPLMLRFVLRRLLQAIPTLLGVLVATWILFFGTASPETIARRNLSSKDPTQAQVQAWIREHGYDQPPVVQLRKSTVDLLLFRFGKSDSTHEDIGERIRKGASPSLLLSSTIFVSTLVGAVLTAVLAAAFRGTAIDRTTTVVCVLLMSIVATVHVIGGQFILTKLLRYGPVWGFDPGGGLAKALLVPSLIGFVAGIAAEIRLFRTFVLEEIGQDYVRTARAKGVPESAVLLRHVLKNALVPIVTNTVATIPGLILGGLLLENFFGIPGLGSYLVDAIGANDFAVVRAMVFLGTLLTIVGLIATDIAYALVDPRVRME
jgi:peptide/nickel transport system permease protein